MGSIILSLELILALASQARASPVETEMSMLGAPLMDYPDSSGVPHEFPPVDNQVTTLIPYGNMPGKGSFSFDEVPTIRIILGDRTFTPQIDMESCGVLIGAHAYLTYNETIGDIQSSPAGYQYIPHSQMLYTGYWVPNIVQFTNHRELPVETSIPVLVYTREVNCPDYNESDPGKCPSPGATPGGIPMCMFESTAPEFACTGSHIGIAFGRTYYGPTQGTVDKHPFLNIISIESAPLPINYNHGFRVGKNGIDIGITEFISKQFRSVTLINIDPNNSPMNWQYPTGCVKVTDENDQGGVCVPGPILLDTKITGAYIKLATQHQIRFGWTRDSDGNLFQVARPGWRFEGYFGQTGHTDVAFSFKMGEKNAPTDVVVGLDLWALEGGVFNTGRYFYRAYDYLFDAQRGKFGLKKR